MDASRLSFFAKDLRLPALFGGGWLFLAAAILVTKHLMGGVALVWLPNGLAVATLFVVERRSWRKVVPVHLAAATFVNFMVGVTPFNAAGLALVNVVEVVIAASIARRISGGAILDLQCLPDLFRLAGAAFCGAVISATISPFFRGEIFTLYSFLSWMFTVMLGTMIGTPIFVHLHKLFAELGAVGGGRRLLTLSRGALLMAGAIFLVSYCVLSLASVQLLFLPMAFTILAVVRFGAIGAACGVLAFAVAGTTVSLGGHAPAAFLGFEPVQAGFVLQIYMLVLIACTIPLASLLVQHGRMEASLERRNARLSENLKMLSLAENISGFGRWHFDVRLGRHTLSPRMRDLLNIGQDLPDALRELRSFLPDRGRVLFREIARHRQQRAPFAFDQAISFPDIGERMIRVSATNEFDAAGHRVALFAVAMDITEQVKREKSLEMAKLAALELAGEAQKLANTDALTGLANRRSILIQLRNMIADRKLSHAPLSAIVFDLDHFKQINDCFGHQMGDRVLTHVAHLARSVKRDCDMIGRTGGEEFVWLLPGADLADANRAAERFRRVVERESSVNDMPRVTTSLGCAEWIEGDDGQSLLSRADKALYNAKGAGRNRVRDVA